MISKLRFRRDMNGRIINSTPIFDRTRNNKYQMSIASDLSEATIKDENDCVIVQCDGNGNFAQIVQTLKNYLEDYLDCQFAMHVFGVGAGGLMMTVPNSQAIFFGFIPTSGIFYLTYNNISAGPFAYNVSDQELEDALRQLVSPLYPQYPQQSTFGAALNYAILAYSTITNTGSSVVNGDVGLHPGTSITGFPPGAINGIMHLADASASAAKLAALALYNDLDTRVGAIDLTGVDLGSLTLAPGVYNFNTSAQLTGTLTLDGQGNPSAEWVFQIGSTLTTASSSVVTMINGGSANNVYWQLGSSATIGTSTTFRGNIIANTSVTANTSATIYGRLFALNGAVTLDTNEVSRGNPNLDLSQVCVNGNMDDDFIVLFGDINSPGTIEVTNSTLDRRNMLVFTQPSSSAPGAVFATQPIIRIRDRNNAIITTGPDSTALVTISLFSGTGVLSGTLSMNAVAGVANFAGMGLSVDLDGIKVLRATKEDTSALVGGSGSLFIDSANLIIAIPSLLAVDLLTAGNYAILTKSGITNVPTSTINGDMGVSPIAAAAITAFALSLDGGGQFSTSAQVSGQVYAADYAAPTPANLTQAVLDMEAAYTDAAGRPADFTNVDAGILSGITLTPGVYKWTTGVTIPTNITFNGGAGDVWILQIAGTLGMSAAQDIILAGGALAENIFWQVSGAVTLGTTVDFNGIILGQTSITLQTGATLNGRILAQTAAALDSNVVTEVP